MSSNAPLATLVAAAVFGVALWWAAAVPFGGAPDEPDHYRMVEFVAQHGRLPRYGEPGFLVSLMSRTTRRHVADPSNRRGLVALELNPQPVELRQTYLFVPQLPYALNGWACRLLGGASAPVARGFNALCVAIAAFLVFLAGRALWPQSRFAAVVAGLCAGLWPQLCFLGAYVNDDAFAVMSAAALVTACVLCQHHEFDRRHAIALGIGVGLVGASKPYGLVFLPLALLWFWRWSGSNFAGSPRFASAGFRRRTLLALGVAAALVVPWLVRNAMLFEGDPTGRRFLNREARAFVESLPPAVKGSAKLLYFDPPERKLTTARLGSWMDITFESFWARFGWMNVRGPRVLFIAALVVLAAGIIGSWPQRRAWWNAPELFAIPGLLLLIAGSLLNSRIIDFQPQGRYLLAAAPALVLQVVGGLAAVRHRGLRIALLAAFLAFFVAQNLTYRWSVLR